MLQRICQVVFMYKCLTFMQSSCEDVVGLEEFCRMLGF